MGVQESHESEQPLSAVEESEYEEQELYSEAYGDVRILIPVDE
jgi:hypothetical protein